MPSAGDFKQSISSGLIRQHRWRILVNFPSFAAANESTRRADLHARTAKTPNGTLGELDLKFDGLDVPIPGDRTYEELPITFLGVQDMEVMEAFEAWQEAINGTTSNTAQVTQAEYEVDMEMQLVDANDNVLKTYTIEAAWPKEIEGMDLDKGASDSYAEFTVTFRFFRAYSNRTR